jgi:trimeric autotransporter adhesin
MFKHLFIALICCVFTQNATAQIRTATLVKDITTGSPTRQNDAVSNNPAQLQNEVFFTASIENQVYLVAFDGTNKRTVFQTGATIDTLMVANNRLFFILNYQNKGWRVWSSDGTNAGTVPLTDTSTSRPFLIGSYNNRLVFGNDTRIYSTTGTVASTIQLPNIPNFNSNYKVLTTLPNKLLFCVTDGVATTALWVTDGTVRGTLNLANTNLVYGFTDNAPPAIFNPQYKLWHGYQDGSTFYFGEYTNVVGEPNLWKTDGTVAGTRRVLQNAATRDILRYGNKLVLILENNSVYTYDGTNTPILVTDFTANDQTKMIAVNGGILLNLIPTNNPNGLATYKFDGTNFTFLKKLSTTLYGSDFFNTGYLDYNGFTYFVCNFGLWRSDGTASGTTRVKSIAPNYTANDFVVRNNKLFFTGVEFNSSAGNGYFVNTLFATSGTASTTLSLPMVIPNETYNIAEPQKRIVITAWTDNLYVTTFTAYNTNPITQSYTALWRTDGTVAGTIKLADSAFTAQPAIPIKQSQYFTLAGKNYATMSLKGNNSFLHTTDGTVAGTQPAVRLNDKAGSICSNFYTLNANKTLFMVESEPEKRQPWVTDGTTNGTKLLANINLSGYLGADKAWLGTINNIAYFVGYTTPNTGQDGLWRTDGTPAGTYLVKKFYKLYAQKSTVLNNKLYFAASDSITGTELWRSDGTASGTQMVKQIFNGNIDNGGYGSSPRAFMVFNNKIYFTANISSTDRVLWQTDGTTAGTVLFKDLYPTAAVDIDIHSPTIYNGVLYFRTFAFDAPNNKNDIWRTDGTANGTVVVRNLNTSCWTYELNGGFTPTTDALYFQGTTGTAGCEVMYSNGTTAGTQTINMQGFTFAGGYRSDDIIAGWNNKIIFNGKSGAQHYPYLGNQTTSTRLSAVPMSANHNMFLNNDKLYFVSDEENPLGSELCRADSNTDSGTIVNDIYTGEYSSSPQSIFLIGDDKFVFTAQNKENSHEIWLGDNTNPPVLLADVQPGVGASQPTNFQIIGTDLIFTAFHENTGRELYKISNITDLLPIFAPSNAPTVLQVFPNPTRSNTIITLKNTSANTANLYDITGKIVATQNISDTETNFVLPKLSAGVYVLRCGQAIAKIVVQ